MPTTISRVLCCLGLKDDCRQVLAHSLSLASACQAEVHVLHAVKSLSDDVMQTLKANIRERRTLDALMEQRRAQAAQRLDEFIEALQQDWLGSHPADSEQSGRQRGDKVSADAPSQMSLITARAVVEGYPASEIIRYATRHDCDMIVMATNKRGFSASYAGKVTKGVIKRASVPVVVVPPV
ncbi:universal stress protein [Halomonas denitrificans]|uniref:universal stress protein n=1 Tax=Halomonas denitrificans TaxID=370769 RepID=UPI001CD27768|nr:universal stress protein [Halomonas denitrificans]MCA0974966.1 universal stress protein [Halomonas denitrificans]MED5294983.1 universal stress protein [Pseudomonadota bacterium]